MSVDTPNSSKFIRIAQMLLIIAIGLSGYLAFQALTGTQVAGCGPEQGCGKVLSSKWSSILTIPISIPGLLTYLALLLVCQLKNLKEKTGGFMGAVLAFAIVFGALWFTALQMFVIKSYCAYCCSTHAIATVASILILITIFRKEKAKKKVVTPNKNSGSKKQRAKLANSGKEKKKEETLAVTPSPRLGIIAPVLISLLMVGVTIALQSVGPEKDRSEVTHSEGALLAAYRATPDSPLQLGYEGGATLIEDDVLQSMTLGSEVAGKDPILLTYIFDWTCDHCRSLHETLHNLSKEDRPLGLEEQFIITYLPGAYETSSDVLHRIMYATSREDEAFYDELVEKVYSGEVQAMMNPVKNAAIDKFGQDEWAQISMKNSKKIKRALALAGNQAFHNEQSLNITIFPQLTSSNSILSGVPTEKALKKFLQEAATQQASYLQSPDMDLKPVLLSASAKARTIDPTKNPNSTQYQLKRNNSKIEFISSRAVRAKGIKVGDIAQATYRFKNTGTDPLKIYNMKGGCICTYGDSKEWNKEILPGETGEITAYYNSHGKSEFGIQNRYIWVTSSASNFDENDPVAARYGNRILLQVPMTDKKGDFLLKDSSGKFFTKKTLSPLDPKAWDPNFMKKTMPAPQKTK